MLSLFAESIGMMRSNVRRTAGSGPPTNSVTGAGDLGLGSTYTDILTGVTYTNMGTLATPIWGVAGAGVVNQILTAAQIVATGVGTFGHAQGVILVPAPGVGKFLALDSCVAIYDAVTAAFTGGGNTTVNWGAGGAAITGLVSAANFAASAADKAVQFVPLSTAGVPLVENASLNLVTTAAFTQPGTAAGTIKIVTNYRLYTLN